MSLKKRKRAVSFLNSLLFHITDKKEECFLKNNSLRVQQIHFGGKPQVV